MGFFVAPDDLPRARRPSDVVSVAFGLLLLLWGVLASDVQTAWEQAFTETITSLPAWATGALSVVFAFGLFYGLGIIVVAFLARRTEGGTLRDLLLAVLLVAALSFLLSWWVTGTWPYVLPDIGLADPEPRFPVVRVAGIAAVMLAASPHLSRPIRRVGWVVIALSAVAAVALGYGTPSDVAGGLGIGFISAGAILLVFGSPRGFPDVDAVSSSLEAMDVDVGDVTIDPDQSWGVRRLRAVSAAGVPIEIKAYGRDAHESQWFAKLWRATWYREDGRTVSYTRLQAVEHEALVTLMATRTGASVADVIAAGSETREVALLATESPGRILAAEQPEEISDDLLRALWSDVQRLHEASIAHGSLTAHAVRVDRTHHWITDFELGVLGSADSDRLVDVVELLFSLAVLVGVDRAVATALDALGRDRIVEALPYVQLPAISASSRRTVKKPKEVVHELQNALAESADTELPEPVGVDCRTWLGG